MTWTRTVSIHGRDLGASPSRAATIRLTGDGRGWVRLRNERAELVGEWYRTGREYCLPVHEKEWFVCLSTWGVDDLFPTTVDFRASAGCGRRPASTAQEENGYLVWGDTAERTIYDDLGRPESARIIQTHPTLPWVKRTTRIEFLEFTRGDRPLQVLPKTIRDYEHVDLLTHSRETIIAPGTPLPDISVVPLDSGAAANEDDLDEQPELALTEYRGQRLLLFTWSAWCPGGRQTMRAADLLFRDAQASGVELNMLGINDLDSTELQLHMRRCRDLRFPMARANDLIEKELGLTLMSHAILVEPDGTVSYASTGFDECALREKLGIWSLSTPTVAEFVGPPSEDH